MTTTVKTLLEKKYIELLKEIKPILNQEIFPEIDDEFDWKEFMDYLQFLFPDEEYAFHLEQLAMLRGITLVNGQIDKLVPIVSRYLNWVTKFKQKYPRF